MLHAARWKCSTQKTAKMRHLGTITQLCRTTSSQLGTYRQSDKKLVKQRCLPHMFSLYGELRPPASEIRWRVLGTPAHFNGFRVLAVLLHGTSSGRQPNFAALNRGRHLFSAGRRLRWALTHILVTLSINRDLFALKILETYVYQTTNKWSK